MTFKPIGDTHLGKEFKNGVPLYRRGEREEMVWQQFDRALYPGEHDTVIQMGDVFDKFRVDLNVVIRAADMIMARARCHPNVEFLFLRGNHDASRDGDKRSSFDLLSRLLEGLDNVQFAVDEPLYWGNMVLLPWHPFIDAKAMAERFAEEDTKIALGHWDKVAFGDHASNLIPLETLAAKGITEVYSGHDHVPDTWTHDDRVKVTFTGSLQPYSHSEDPDGKLYVTLPLEEALTRSDLQNKCVRVLLAPGEGLPDIDCLQLTGKCTDGEEEDITVDFDSGLNVRALFDECLTGIAPDVVAAIRAKFEEIQSA